MKFNELDKRYRWYSVELIDQRGAPCTYVFRGVTVAEMRRAGSKRTQIESETFILEQCVLPAQDWSDGLAGVSKLLLQNICKISGLDEEQYPFVEAVHNLTTESGALETAAVCMISGLTFEHLDTADPVYRAKYLAAGKFMFESLYNCSVFDAFRPQQEQQQGVIPGAGHAPAAGAVVAPPPPQIPGAENYKEESSYNWVRKG